MNSLAKRMRAIGRIARAAILQGLFPKNNYYKGGSMLQTLKKVIKHPEKIVFGLEKKGLLGWVSEEAYLKLIYKLIFKRSLHLDQPITFTEKITWYKLHWRNPLARDCVDKLKVREYVSEKIGAEYLNEVYGCWDSFDEIDFNKLPEHFVLKPTNGSGDIVICKDKSSFDPEKARAVLCQFKQRHFSTRTKEWAYYGLPHRILAERLIKRQDFKSIYDYKIFCFFGKPQFLLVGSDRETDVKFSYFDLNWNPIPVKCGHGYNPYMEKPKHFNEMLKIAHRLSEDFPHVRVDLYEEEGKVYFGELTFYHYGGIIRFEPDEWDYAFGKLFDVEKIPKEQII